MLQKTPVQAFTFLTTENGTPYKPGEFSEWFRRQCNAAGLPKHCVPHGLRHAAATLGWPRRGEPASDSSDHRAQNPDRGLERARELGALGRRAADDLRHVARVKVRLPGSTRSGENARKKSTPAFRPPRSSSGCTTSSVVPG